MSFHMCREFFKDYINTKEKNSTALLQTDDNNTRQQFSTDNNSPHEDAAAVFQTDNSPRQQFSTDYNSPHEDAAAVFQTDNSPRRQFSTDYNSPHEDTVAVFAQQVHYCFFTGVSHTAIYTFKIFYNFVKHFMLCAVYKYSVMHCEYFFEVSLIYTVYKAISMCSCVSCRMTSGECGLEPCIT